MPLEPDPANRNSDNQATDILQLYIVLIMTARLPIYCKDLMLKHVLSKCLFFMIFTSPIRCCDIPDTQSDVCIELLSMYTK